jgi:hypothetical protein
MIVFLSFSVFRVFGKYGTGMNEVQCGSVPYPTIRGQVPVLYNNRCCGTETNVLFWIFCTVGKYIYSYGRIDKFDNFRV